MYKELDHNERLEILAELEGFRNIFLEKLFAKYNTIRNSRFNVTLGQLKQFHILEDLPGIKMGKGYSVTNGDSLIKTQLINTEGELILRGRHYQPRRKLEFYDSFCICAFISSRDFGRTIIRTEKFVDKFAELFERTDFDFEEFEEFSSRYYCLSNHPEKLKQSLDKDVAQHFVNNNLNIGAEFNDNLCLLKIPYSVREYDKNLEFVEFALGLQKLIGEKIPFETL